MSFSVKVGLREDDQTGMYGNPVRKMCDDVHHPSQGERRVVFDEQLFSLGSDGVFVCLTIPHPGFSRDAYRDIRHAYAFVGRLGSPQRTECLTLLTVPVAADIEQAQAFAEAAEGMTELIDRSLPRMQPHYLQSQATFRLYAEQFQQPSRLLPDRVCGSAAGRLLVRCQYHTARSSRIERHKRLRVVDCRQPALIFEHVIHGDDDNPLAEVAQGRLPRQLRGEMEQAIQSMGDPLALSADGDTVLFWQAPNSCYAARVAPGLPRLFASILPRVANFPGAWCQGCWIVVAYDQRLRRNQVIVLDGETGTCERQITCRGTIASLSAAITSPHVAVGLMGGVCQVIDITRGRTRAVKPHRGIPRDTWIQVALSPDGRYLASWNRQQEAVYVTDIAAARATEICSLPPYTEVIASRDHLTVHKVLNPGMGWGHDTLFTLRYGAVTAYPLEAYASARDGFDAALPTGRRARRWRYDKQRSLVDNLSACGLARVAPALAALWSPPLRLQSQPPGTKKLLAGCSRLGGEPDLVSAAHWPRWHAYPMVFVAQLNLAEVAQLLPTSPLPRRGLLSFFLGVDAENKMPLPSGEPEERGAWSVLYQPDMAPLASVAYPGPTADLWQYQFPACRLTLAQRGPALPAEDAACVQALVLSPTEMERYLDLLEQVNPDRQTWRLGHQLLGYPSDLQGNHMERLCARAFHGLDPYVVEGMDDPHTQRVEHEATAWTLLLQLNSDPHAELLWGDAGMLYWFIRRQELHAGRFETTWIQVQH